MKSLRITSLRALPVKSWEIARLHWKKVLLGIAVGIPVLGISYFLLHEEQPEYITDIARRGKLIQVVEGIGTVISEKDLQLKFPLTGVVENVYVVEGDTVEEGQVLAELRNNSLEADVSSASANYQSALADLREIEEGTRPEEILIAEAEVENKRAALSAAKASLEAAERNLDRSKEKLEDLRREADTSLSGHVSTAGSVVSQELTKIQNSLQELDDDFDTTVIRNAVDFRARIEYDIYLRKRKEADDSISYALRGSNPSGYADALRNLEDAKKAALQAVDAANGAYSIIVSLPTTNYLTTSVKETYKDSSASERDSIQAAYNNIEDEMKIVRDASANFSSKISAEEGNLTASQGTKDKALADITTYQTSLRIQEAQLALKKAGARKADIDSARASVNRAYADVQRARAKLDDTILIAPIAGSITKVNLKTGEFTGGIEDYERAITMLGDSPYRVEMYASEIDIPKVAYDQEGAIEPDAYQGRDFLLQVSEIDPAATIVDGVPKYRIKLDFLENEEASLKIGMTGDVDIITGIQENAVMVSGRAVLKNVLGEDIVRILKNEALEERTVVVGMETDTDVEILSGVEEGEVVVVLIKE